MQRRLVPISLLALVTTPAIAQERTTPHSVRPPKGLVPNEATAIKIAIAVWEPIYGAEQIAEQAPYRVALRAGVWVVTGSLPPGSLGGVAIAEIAREDGRVLRVSHGK